MNHVSAASTLSFHFKAPADLAAKGIYLGVFGQLTADYTPSGGTPISSGTHVFLSGEDFAPATPSTNLPLITLFETTPPPTTKAELTATIALPLASIKGGAFVIGIGAKPIMKVSAAGAPSVPTVDTNPCVAFGLFEYSFLDGKLDVDLSEVDQVGFPFQMASDPPAPYPAENGVGMTVRRDELFSSFRRYPAFQANVGMPYLRCLDDGCVEGVQYRLVAPQTILDKLESGGPALNSVTYSSGGKLAIGTAYYYVVTACSGSGETMPSANFQCAVPYEDSGVGPKQTANLSWAPFPNATSYNLYRSTKVEGQSLVEPALVANTVATSFSDEGGEIRKQVPPLNNYTFEPLAAWFTEAISSFFSHYTQTDSFALTVDGTIWKGKVVKTYSPSWATQPYTALKLTAKNGTNKGKSLHILRPFFSSNMPSGENYPPMPAWMTAAEGTSPTESPAQMVFGCDGVFQTGPNDPEAISQGLCDVLKDIENRIVTAFNRGLATEFGMPPDNWANFPLLMSATPCECNDGELSSSTTYFYVMTSIDGVGNESTPSLELSAKLTGSENAVALKWEAYDPPSTNPPTDTPFAGAYNIYRGKTQGIHNELICTMPNNGPTPAIEFIDKGNLSVSKSPPYAYYPEGKASNLYAKFLHQEDISIKGLVYGFPFDDQGGLSTNIGFPETPDKITIRLNAWTKPGLPQT